MVFLKTLVAMQKTFFISLIIFLSVTIYGQDDSYIGFEIRNAGITVNGTFSDFNIDIKIDPSDLSNAKFNGSIQVKSIDTGIKKRDKDLMNKSYFDVENHPKIVFIATSVESGGNGKYEITGKLKIKGVTKTITFEVIEVAVSGKKYFKGEFELNRRDFNVGGNSWILADELKASIRLREG
jgi:polyisoprenoid-binding protein YceI